MAADRFNASSNRPCSKEFGGACYGGEVGVGFCGATGYGRACDIHHGKGAWAADSERDCLMQCAACGRCRYISFSAKNRDCSWFYACNRMDNLEVKRGDLPVAVWTSYTTLELAKFDEAQLRELRDGHAPECKQHILNVTRDTPPQPTAEGLHTRVAVRHPRHRIRLAIASIHVPSPDPCHGYSCGLLAWCSSASRLREALPIAWRVDLLMLASSVAPAAGGRRGCMPDVLDVRDCPQMRTIHPSTNLVAAVDAYARRRKGQFIQRAGLTRTLLKWELMGRTEYNAIFFSDIDVDVRTHTPVHGACAWRMCMALAIQPRFLEDRALAPPGHRLHAPPAPSNSPSRPPTHPISPHLTAISIPSRHHPVGADPSPGLPPGLTLASSTLPGAAKLVARRRFPSDTHRVEPVAPRTHPAVT